MSDIQIHQMPAFKKAYKKMIKSHKLIVNEAIRAIVQNSTLGEEKKGDLEGIYVYKFKMNEQEFMLAYTWDSIQRLLLALGVHENFYRDLNIRK